MKKRLLEEEAHLWLQPLDEDAPAPSLETLSEPERQRAAEIRHERTRRHFIAGRDLARRSLSRYTDVDPSAWRFEISEDGRPEIAAPATDTALRFNLSHTDGLAVCLVTDAMDCGVDAEHIGRRVNELRIAAHSFSQGELHELEALPPAARRVRFAELWTLKEAFLKALGSGIRLRLDAVTFPPVEDRVIQYRLAENIPESSPSWHFSLFRHEPDHLLAAAVRGERSRGRIVTCWQLDDSQAARQLEMTASASTARLQD